MRSYDKTCYCIVYRETSSQCAPCCPSLPWLNADFNHIELRRSRRHFALGLLWYLSRNLSLPHHDDVIKWKHFPRNWPFVRKIHRSPVNFPHKGQWRGALMFSLIYVWINDWANNREAGDLRRQHGHYDVIVMSRIFHDASMVTENPSSQLRNAYLPQKNLMFGSESGNILSIIQSFHLLHEIIECYPRARQ